MLDVCPSSCQPTSSRQPREKDRARSQQGCKGVSSTDRILTLVYDSTSAKPVTGSPRSRDNNHICNGKWLIAAGIIMRQSSRAVWAFLGLPSLNS